MGDSFVPLNKATDADGAKIATDKDGLGRDHQKALVEFIKSDIPTKVSESDRFPVAAHIEAMDSASVDAFGRWRVSNPVTLFDSKLLAADKQPLFWDEALESGAGITSSTPTVSKPYLDFTSTASTAGKFTRQTFRRFNYQPGKSQLVLMTGVLNLSGGGTGVERRIGYFDNDNGAFFEDDAGVVGVTIRSNDSGTPADTTVAQTSWNIDKMDGAGPSKHIVDWTKGQIFVLDFQWLSIGRVRFGLEIGTRVHYVHAFNQANVSTIPWASTPNLPLRYQMITTASSPASSMRVICSSVISEGGSDVSGLDHTHATTDHVNANDADILYALLGVRLKAMKIGCTFVPVSVSVLSETADNFEWMLIHNPTVVGTFTYGDKGNSCAQVATGDTANPSTNIVADGTIIARGFGASATAISVDVKNTLTLGVAIGGALDTLVLAVRPLGANADIQGALTWREVA